MNDTETLFCYNCFCERTESEGACSNCGYDPEWGKEKYPLALPHGHVLCDKYILGRVLGQGGYGITYLAMDKWLGMKVAVKEYFREIGATRTISTCHVTASSIQKQEEYQKGKEDFLQEARVLAAFTNNPNIVRIHGYFEENGTAYFVMDYIEGISLQKYIANQGGHIHWRDAYEKLLPIIKALEEVHQKDIIHRDISPDNIYITSDGTMKLLDFGAARFQSLNQSHSLDVVLKHGYAPFEQYNRRGKQGPFTDVYALCACFYAAVTGVLPPDAPERMEEDRIESFSVMGYEVPQAVEAVIFKGLEVKSKDRYQNMTELLEALEQAVENNQSEEITIDESNQQENWTTEENNQSVDSQTEENSQLENPTLEETNLSDEQMTDTEKSKSKFLSVLQPILTKWNLLPKKTKLGVGIACCAVLLVGVGIFWFVHPHSYGEWEIVQAATCLDAGLQERKCFCGEKQTEVINALGHHEVVDNAVSATCPYCNKTSAPGMGASVAGARPTIEPNRTAAPGGWAGNANNTMGGPNWNERRSVVNGPSTVEPESHRRKIEDEQKTRGKYEEEMGIEPVAGWLVCVNGADKGKSFPIVCRINFIGRSESMDVCLKKDLTITKSNHAQVSYEPRHRKFYLIRGESKNNIYLNDVPVYVPTEINAYDVLGFGDTDLIFIPFCGPNFSWETGLNKE